MSLFLYHISLFLYYIAIRFYSLMNEKARKWVKGRKNWQEELKASLPAGEKRIWVHAASVGEFEQAKPVIESLRKKYPDHKILLSFFSPSGYEVAKKYEQADHVTYLPMDSRSHANSFIDLVNPSLVIFVKYEFWYHYLTALHQRNIPVILISAAFRKEQPFFQWYGGLFRRMLHTYNNLFVQDEPSKDLLEKIGVSGNVIVSGDTRYDRVAEIAHSLKTIPIVEQFRSLSKLIFGGSTWPEDEKLLKDCMPVFPPGWKLVVAPHEINEMHLRNISVLFGEEMVLYSVFEQTPGASEKRVLVVDNIGILSSLYSYGEIAFIGGGFQRGGIHNILEPAVFGLPVLFGPGYTKFVEANLFVKRQFAFPVFNQPDAGAIFGKLMADNDHRLALQESIREYMKGQTGATETISNYISRHILL